MIMISSRSTYTMPSTYNTSKFSHVSSSNYGRSSPKTSIYDSYSTTSGSAYTNKSTASSTIPRNNTRDLQSRYNGTSLSSRPPSGHRPLPKGPGPLDTSGNKYEYKTRISKNSYRTDNSRSTPVRATQKYDSDYRSSDHRYSPPGSYSNLNRTSKKYGSTSSINSLHEDNIDLKTGRKTSTHTFNLNNVKDSLPHLSHDTEVRGRRESRGSDSSDTSPTSRRASSTSRRASSASRHSPNLTNSRESMLKSESQKLDSINNNQGLMGLRNLGNTCYMNCMIQGLVNTRLLLEYLESHQWERETNSSSRMRGCLIEEFAKLVRRMWSSSTSSSGGYSSSYTSSYSSSSYVSPSEFRAELCRYARRFGGYGQQDAQEFLIYLLEGLHEDINKVQKKVPKEMLSDEYDSKSAAEKARASWTWYQRYDDSFIVDMCVGQLKSSLECQVCHYVSNTFDPYWEIPLPLKKKSYGINSGQNLLDCFEDFTRSETLDGDERPTCERCKKRQKCKKQFSIWKFPPVLILHLKRFDPMASYPTKLTTSVDFPLEKLDLSKYAANPSDSSDCIYDLYSVSNHSGTARGGHYTAYTRHPYSGEWHHFNDQSCSPISTRRIVSPEAYVLFYEKRSSKSLRKRNSHL